MDDAVHNPGMTPSSGSAAEPKSRSRSPAKSAPSAEATKATAPSGGAKPEATPDSFAAARAIVPLEQEAGGTLEIDLAAIVNNWRRLASIATPADCAAVVKGDGYGCGLEVVAKALSRAGCKTFFVADLTEARKVREIASGAIIYVLSGIGPSGADVFADLNARPVVNTAAEFAEWQAFSVANNWQGGAALHIDTGMNRLGLGYEEASALSARSQTENHGGISLVMSHLACADTPNHALNKKQIDLFREIRSQFRGVAASLANSSGIFLGNSTHWDVVRPGAAIFGVNPTPQRNNPMLPVVGLKGRILQVRDVKRGDSVGYGASFTAQRASRVAIVAVGYADGYLRAAGGREPKANAQVVIGGRQCPLVGRVSMDLMAADVTDVESGAVKRGDWATLIGGELTVDKLGAWCGTIGYEILTGLGRRYHRVYKSE